MSLLLNQKNIVSNLKMLKRVSSLPRCYKRYLKLLQLSGDHGTKLQDWDGYVFFNCIRALIPGMRYYWSNHRWNYHGSQGLETTTLKHKSIKKFYTLGKQIKAFNNEAALKEFRRIVIYVDNPIDELCENNECIFVESRKDKDDVINRLYIEWHSPTEEFCDIFDKFDEYIKRLEKGCVELQRVIDKCKGVSSC